MPAEADPPRPPPGTNPADDDAFARKVSQARHDLRNPLAHILGFTEMLIEKTGLQGLNFLKSRLQVIERSANELTQAVNGELDPERLAAGRSQIAGLEKSIQKLSARIIQTAGSLRQKPAVRADATFGEDLVRVIGAAHRLREMAGSTLEFLLAPAAGDCGVPGGRPPVRPMSARGAPSHWATGRILLCVAAAARGEALEQMLTGLGHQVQTVKDVPELNRALDASPPDLILLDLSLAEAEDSPVIEVQRDRAGSNSPAVLIVCNSAQLPAAARCLEGSASDCLTGPLLPSVVKARVEGCLARRWLRRGQSAAAS